MRDQLGRGWLVGGVASVALACLVGVACAASQSAAPRAAPAESQAVSGAPGAAVVPAAAAPARPPAEPVRLKFHFPSRSTSYLPWYVAIERGYFREAGLDVEMLQAPGTVGVQALIAGEMDFSASTTRPMVAIARGVPLKV